MGKFDIIVGFSLGIFGLVFFVFFLLFFGILFILRKFEFLLFCEENVMLFKFFFGICLNIFEGNWLLIVLLVGWYVWLLFFWLLFLNKSFIGDWIIFEVFFGDICVFCCILKEFLFVFNFG